VDRNKYPEAQKEHANLVMKEGIAINL